MKYANPRHVGHFTYFKLKFVTLASNPERNLLCSAKVARGGFQFPTTNQVHSSAQSVPVRKPVQWTQFGVENEQTDDMFDPRHEML